MALTKCPACSAKVSENAKACLKCGHPFTRGFLGTPGTSERSWNVGCLFVIAVVVVSGLMMVLF
jgi:hypothetical protein